MNGAKFRKKKRGRGENDPAADAGSHSDSPSAPSGDPDDREMASLVDAITTSPAKELDVALIKSVKDVVRRSDSNVQITLHLLMEKLKFNHAQVRYLGLLVMDELFTRSKLFRDLLIPQFEMFMLLTVGFRSDYPLPPPVDRATLLKAKSMEVIEKWNDKFGLYYKQLRLGFEYLKNSLRLQFPNLRQVAAQEEERRKEREARSQALTLQKYHLLKDEFSSAKAEIVQTLNEMDECLAILNTSVDKEEKEEEDIFADESDAEAEEYGVKTLRVSGGGGVVDSVSKVPIETGENAPIFDILRDLTKLVITRHIPSTQEWLSILMKVETEDSSSRDSILKDVIDIRNQLLAARGKSFEVGIEVSTRNRDGYNEDDIVWEVGVREKEETTNQVDTASNKDEGEKNKDMANLEKTEKSRGKSLLKMENTSEVKEELLKQAPVLPWGSYLDRWGGESAILVNQRGLMLENHWGRVDYDALIPPDKFKEISMQASYYKPEKTEIRPCSAPMRNGTLCQRRDLVTCPFHGPIIPRDDSGKPIQEEGVEEKKVADSESSVAKLKSVLNSITSEEERSRIVATEAIANVRKREEKSSNHKSRRKLQLKRDREHNDAVLRSAALTNTRQGLGEALGGEDLEGFASGSGSKRPKSLLRAMLQRKPSVKDRLAKRLLNVRVRDATVRQLVREEDTAYKESFPNQW